MANGTPKPLVLLEGHRTKAEKEIREKAEKELMTGSSFSEWSEVKESPVAHKQFMKMKKTFKAIGKDDALIESVINRYCLLHSEVRGFGDNKIQIEQDLTELKELYRNKEVDSLTYLDKREKLYGVQMACDKKIMEKRKMMLDIEKENLMTLASAMRSIPKKPDKKKEATGIAAFREQRRG